MVHIISRCGRLCLLIASASVAVSCGEAPTTGPPVSGAPSPSPPADVPRIVFLGDSLSAGYGLAGTDAFPAVAETLLREAGTTVEVINAGVSGDTSAGGLARVDWVLGQRPDVLVVELGANDALRGQPLESTEENLRQIVRRGGEAGARVLLLGMDVPTNYGSEYASAFAEMYVRIAEDEGVPIVTGFVRDVGTDPALMQPDGLHPTAEGHRRLAEALVPLLEEMVSRPTSEAPSGSPS